MPRPMYRRLILIDPIQCEGLRKIIRNNALNGIVKKETVTCVILTDTQKIRSVITSVAHSPMPCRCPADALPMILPSTTDFRCLTVGGFAMFGFLQNTIWLYLPVAIECCIGGYGVEHERNRRTA